MDRLVLLKETMVISEETFHTTKKCEEYLLTKFETSENLDMLIAHLAMMLERINKLEDVNPISDEVYKEIKDNFKFKEALDILEHLNKLSNNTFPESEERYILLHLVNLLNI